MRKSNLQLYQEYPEPGEQQTINAIIDLLIGHLKIQYRGLPKLRDTHTKSNGLVKGRFQVLPNLPDELCVGLFRESRSYDCWIRFSNSDSFISNDKAKDFRGISLKLFEVEGEMVIADIGHFESEQFTIDLIHSVILEKYPNFAVLKSGTVTNPVNYYI